MNTAHWLVRGMKEYDSTLQFKRIPSGIFRSFSQLGLDSEQLVIFRNPIRSGWCASLDLTHVQGYSQVSNGAVLGFTGAVGGDCPPASSVAGLDRFDRLAQGADLVEFHQQGIAGFFSNAAPDAFRVGHQQVVADDLDFVT